MPDQEPDQAFERLLAEAVEKQLEADEAFERAKAVRPEGVHMGRRWCFELVQARAAGKGAGYGHE